MTYRISDRAASVYCAAPSSSLADASTDNFLARPQRRPRFCLVLERGCAGVDLQVVDGEVVSRRERYPDRSTAYERSQGVRAEFAAQGYDNRSGAMKRPSLTSRNGSD